MDPVIAHVALLVNHLGSDTSTDTADIREIRLPAALLVERQPSDIISVTFDANTNELVYTWKRVKDVQQDSPG